MALEPRIQMQQLRQLIAENHEDGWDKAWQENVTPWDIGKPQLALQKFIESKALELPMAGKALVPGCGRGYDAIFIATSLGLDTLAIDISPTAVEAANALVKSSNLPPTVKVAMELGDFFACGSAGQKFDLVYDYTFFVAILPSQRNEWAKTMSAIVESGGYLITLVFPLDPPSDTGPPFYVRPEHYAEALGAGWDKVYDEVPETELESRVGRERMIVWKKL
ncbi:S-adenosyl-L-methionine-dependent methyltransferase [Sparassis latifolia]